MARWAMVWFLFASLVQVADAAQTCEHSNRKCKEIASCEEATYYMEHCGEKNRVDSDKDGIPCENVCGKTLQEYQAKLGRKK